MVTLIDVLWFLVVVPLVLCTWWGLLAATNVVLGAMNRWGERAADESPLGFGVFMLVTGLVLLLAFALAFLALALLGIGGSGLAEDLKARN